MSEDEKVHQTWIANSLDDTIKERIIEFPYLIKENIEGINVVFMHYALNNGKRKKIFKSVEKNISEETMNILFEDVDAEIIFFGHEHMASNIKGKKHYINVGSSGCTKGNTTHCMIVEFEDRNYDIQVYQMKYDKKEIFEQLYERRVPERDFISKVFFYKTEDVDFD